MENGQATLLIVDDNEDNLFVLRQVVEDRLPDCCVVTARDAHRGIELAKSTNLDGALIDVHMPETDGIEMCRRLKKSSDTAAIPTLLITSHSACSDLKAQGLDAGADDFIMRPIDNIELAARIKVMLRIKRAEDALSAEKREVERLLKTRTSKLAVQEKSYRTLVDSLPDAVLKFDSDMRLVCANPVAKELLGAGAVGKTLFALEIPEWRSGCWQNKIREIFAGAEKSEGEFESKRTGKRMVFDWRLLPELDERGKAGALLIFRDVTQNREIEDRLRQAEKMQAIGCLAGGVAHDFNNQLAGIMGYAELLTYKLEDPDLIEYAQAIITSAQHSADLTGQLLAFARKGKSITSPVDVHSVIDEVVSILERTIDKRIRVKKTLRAKHHVVTGDLTLLQNALLNIGINARDAMPEGGKLTFVTREVEGEEIPDGISEKCLQISVCDDGVGMDEDVRQRIFEPFFTTKRPGKGTGMGLAAVYGAVKSHGGAIEAKSELGRGSTFDIYLPISAIKSKSKSNAFGSVCKGSGHILVVDDEPAVRESTAALLRDLGYTVALCEDGVEALEQYRNGWRETDLVILDVVMPKIGGKKTLFGLQDINSDVKVLVVSGYSVEGEAQEMIAAGALGFVQKPCPKQILATKVRKALNG